MAQQYILHLQFQQNLRNERCDIFIKIYDQLCLLIIDEVSLVNNRRLIFIDCRP
jgi:hypothetical protein